LAGRGGKVAYSVCTMTSAETVELDRWMANEHPQWRAGEPPGAPWEPSGRGGLLLPQTAGTDGMFLVSYVKDEADRR
jgi:16S rRNA (cytosine967-C5)-methyltransferase